MQLRLSRDDRDGDFDGMSHAGTELSIRNLGQACMLSAPPIVELRDRRGRALPTARQALPETLPEPAAPPVRLGGGHRAAFDLRWISGPVYPSSRRMRAASVTVRIGGAVLRAPLAAVLYGPAGVPVLFDQTPLRAVEGMPAG